MAAEVVAAVRGARAPRFRLAAPLHRVAAGLVGAAATAVSSAAAHAAPPAGPVTLPPVAAAPTAATTTQVRAVKSTNDPLRYVVAHDDWLEGVADRFLGDPDTYQRIAALNPDLAARDARFPDHIEPGWVLVLPTDAVDRGPIPHATGTLATPPPPAPPGSSPVVPAPAPTVSVYPQPDPDDEPPAVEVPVGGNQAGAMAGAGLLSTLALLALQAERRRQTQHRRPGQRLPNPRGGTTERDLRTAGAPADVERLDLALRHLADALADRAEPPDIVGVRLINGDVHVLLAGGAAEPPPLWLDEGGSWVLPGSTPLPVLPVGDRALPTLTAVGSRAGRHLLLDLERLGSLTITGDPGRAAALLRYMACELACNTWSEDAEIIITGFADTEAAWLRELSPHRVVLAASVSDAATQLRRHITATRQALDALELPDTLHGRLRGVAVDAWIPHVLLAYKPSPNEQATLATLHRELGSAGRSGAALIAAIPAGPALGESIANVTADGALSLASPLLAATTDAAGLPPLELEKVAEILRLARTTDLPTAAEDEGIPVPTPVPESVATPPIDPADVVRNLYDPAQWPTSEPSLTPVLAPRTRRPAVPISEDDALDADLGTWNATHANPPRISILGSVDIDASGIAPDRRFALHAEVVVFLAAHPRGASQWDLSEAIWPEGTGDNSVRMIISGIRRWLGETNDGTSWLPDARETNSLYQLQPGYLLDWHLFRRLHARAQRRGASGIGDLHTALSLVRGRPLAGEEGKRYGRSRYTWLGESAVNPPHVVAGIIDAAHRLAELHFDHEDSAGVRWAVQQAWTADPDRIDDQPWLDLMAAERLDGNRASLQQLVDQLVRARGYDVPEELAPATFQAIDKLQQ